jgi:hypothetical protein
VTVQLLLSDIQYPYCDKKAIEAVIRFIKKFKPDEINCVGDELDSPQPSRWTKGMAGEFAGTFHRDRMGCHDMMADFRDALGDKPFRVSRSNHGDRIEEYVRRYAPALGSLPELKIDALLGYDELGIEFMRQPFAIAPGWMMAHGDESGMSQIAGTTALRLAKKMGKSLAIGHTHRMCIQPESVGVNGRVTTLTGFEVGHLMNMTKAGYLGFGAANWQKGFGLLYVDGKNVTPVAVPIHNDGSFTIEGKVYR